MSNDEFSTIVLDGSMLHAAWSQLYSRCGQIIRSAIKRKGDGIGCFARPEADVALMGLLAVMDAVDPEAEWLETGMTTYLYSIDDALQRAREVWWGQEWLAPIEGTSIPFKDFNAAALLRPVPRSTHASLRIIAQLLIGVRELKPPVKPGRDAVARRRMLYDALLRRLEAVRGLLARPDGSFPRAKPINLDPLPPELGEPLWRNTRRAPFLPPDVAYQRRFGRVLMLGLYGALREASRAMDLLPRYLGLENLPQGYDEYRLPHLKYWLDVTLKLSRS